ncbi:MAG: hypothetical protein J6T73_02620, partial [Clostridia bacterium]|nr:hypothetical protein [Clostridia bacterium]
MADTQRKLNKAISVLLGTIAAVLLVSAIVILVIHYWPVKENYSNFKNNSSTADNVLPANPIDFDALKAQNDDVCGWINFDCLDIDYPIVCAGPEKPEEY